MGEGVRGTSASPDILPGETERDVTAPTVLEPKRVEPRPEAQVTAVPARSRRTWLWVLALAVLCLGGYGLLGRKNRGLAGGGDPAQATGARGVPVAAAPARRGDVPIYLSGLGSVVAFNTVTVKSRVDGTLDRVAFREGQFVHEGDLLAEIDPRPFRMQLEQAEGQMARDAAT